MKKGFTLIELLAVIVILAVIALITIPAIRGVINDSQDTSYLRSAELYVSAVNTALSSRAIVKPIVNETCTVQSTGNLLCGEVLLEIDLQGTRPTSGTIEVEEGNIVDVQDLLIKDYLFGYNANGIIVEIKN